jgi:L-galactose dehydrogenase
MIYRPLGLTTKNDRLPPQVSIVGLGCSSFSTFFWTNEEECDDAVAVAALNNRQHVRVQEWIETIHFAILTAGITLLDTAPWYGHGRSEMVVGWALQELFLNSNNSNNSSDENKRKEKICGTCLREDLIVNTKVGRYEKQLDQQFDFSHDATMASVERSLQRLQCSYIDVLQLHDAEFAPNMELLLQETIPAMMTCRNRGWCKALGLTGYPLAVQHQILQVTLEKFPTTALSIWDQALTYGHYNLHDRSLFWPRPSSSSSSSTSCSFFQDCVEHRRIAVFAAAPLSMGLLTSDGPPAWHPAGPALKQACRRAVDICKTCSSSNRSSSSKDKEPDDVDIVTIALTMALAEPRIPCTLLGMKNIDEVQTVCDIVSRLEKALNDSNEHKPSDHPDDIIQKVLTTSEYQAYQQICNVHDGPFAQLWKSSSTATSLLQGGGGDDDNGKESDVAARYDWDGIQQVRNFYSELFQMRNNDIQQQTASSRDMVTEWQVVEPPIPAPPSFVEK